MKPKRVLFFGTYDVEQGYPRSRSLMQSLESQGIEVFGLRESLLPTKGKRMTLLRSPWLWPGQGLKIMAGGFRLRSQLRALLREEQIDAIIVPYPGYLAVKWARDVFDGPVFLDLFLSLSDTIVSDRRLFRAGGRIDHLLKAIDRRACDYADGVFLDTPEHQNFVVEETGSDPEKFFFVPVGDPWAPKEPYPFPALEPGQDLRAVYLGTGVPLHGVSTLLSGVARTEGLHLTFIGGTPAHRHAARALGSRRVTVIEDWLGSDRIHGILAAHHAVFGVFGTSDKAGRVVPYKLVHALSAGRAGVTAETSSICTLLDPGSDCYTCQAGDSSGLARVLRGIVENPQLASVVAKRARRSYERMFSPEAIGSRLLMGMELITGDSWCAPKIEDTSETCTSDSAPAELVSS
jgi:glycosyltransferase involved in cell wall biosynthesis